MVKGLRTHNSPLLGCPFGDEAREVWQTAAAARQRARGFDRLIDLFGQHRARARDSPDGRKSRLAGGRVLSRRLAERRGIRLDVEQIVLDLESEADRAAVGIKKGEVLFGSEGEKPADRQGSADQAAGL